MLVRDRIFLWNKKDAAGAEKVLERLTHVNTRNGLQP